MEQFIERAPNMLLQASSRDHEMESRFVLASCDWRATQLLDWLAWLLWSLPDAFGAAGLGQLGSPSIEKLCLEAMENRQASV